MDSIEPGLPRAQVRSQPPPEDEPLDALGHLERFLTEADPVRQWDPQIRTAHRTLRVQLPGGVVGVVKIDSRGEKGPAMVKAEAAAWVVARRLGWSDLVPATVLRNLQVDGEQVDASLQIQMDVATWVPARASLSPRETLRAAVLDIVVYSTDREHNNWFVTGPPQTRARLVLVDHGHAFGVFPARRFQSSFVERHDGDALPAEALSALRGFLARGLEADLADLLPPALARGVRNRAQRLLDARRVARPDLGI